MLQIHKPINDVLSQDPALIGYDTLTYLFTDISFGVDNVHRIIVQRYVIFKFINYTHGQ